jgi:hypothetical protein
MTKIQASGITKNRAILAISLTAYKGELRIIRCEDNWTTLSIKVRAIKIACQLVDIEFAYQELFAGFLIANIYLQNGDIAKCIS